MREQKHKSSGTRIIILPRASLKNNGELIVVMVIYVHNESQRLAPPPDILSKFPCGMSRALWQKLT